MKASAILLAALLLCPAGCLDYGLNPGKMRADCFNRNPVGSSGGNPDAPPEMLLYDTTLYFCAVRFDESYDWQRDTAYGSESFELLLYRNFEPVLSVSSAGSGCVSADFDTHHIIGGHLYTEKSDLSSTVIGRDGVEIIRFEGREFLKGLLPDGEDIYTLSQSRDGEGFSFRKNGEPLLVRSEGRVFGSMVEPSYGATGALYLDEGVPAFCYWTGSGASREFFGVRGGAEQMLRPGATAASSVNDIKFRQGEARTDEIDAPGYRAVNCRLWNFPSNLVTAGYMASGDSYFSGAFSRASYRVEWICGSEAEVYCSETSAYAVADDRQGGISIFRSGDELMHERGRMFLSPACAVLCGERMFCALSRQEGGGNPEIWEGGKKREVEVHGYVSRVAVEVNPAS